MSSARPFISGFTICRNCIQLDYPFIESIRSLLPLVDELVAVVGASTDGTREALVALNEPKLRIVDSVWDESLRKGGRVLAVETNKALAALNPATDWAIYIQADEVLHEAGYDAIRQAIAMHHANPAVEGLLLNYTHFWASYDWVADGTNWYRREIRIIRNTGRVQSWSDAQGFRTLDGQKLRVKPVAADMYHYGWVKHPSIQKQKELQNHRFWHSDEWISANVQAVPEFDYYRIESLVPFHGTHPAVMADRIARSNWEFRWEQRNPVPLKERFKRFCRRWFGYIPGEYRNYRVA